MIRDGDTVVTGVSGGADSVCLIFMLAKYRERVPFSLAVVHVNHGLRQEADRDAEYVKQLCEELQLPFYLKKADVREVSRREKISAEEAGRKVRYEAFAHVLEELGGDERGKIAVAHNQSDAAETMLFHLFRGTGVYGMAGILPVREHIIRPLLPCSRQEIEDWLRERKISWCIDSTNEEDTYTRNRIRHHILPYAEEKIVAGATRHVAQAAMQLGGLREYLETQTATAAAGCVHFSEVGAEITLQVWQTHGEWMQNQILLWTLERLAGGRRDLTSRHILALRGLAEKQGNKKVDLPGDWEGVRQYGLLVIRNAVEREEDCACFAMELKIPGSCCLPDGSVLEVQLIHHDEKGGFEKINVIEENVCTKYLDYGKINHCLMVRGRRTGDYITINESFRKKSVKSFMIDKKIPAEERDRLPLVADGSHIMWVIGHRISAYYKITNHTKQIVQMRIRRRPQDGRED